MATAAPNPNENGPSRMRKIMSYSVNEDIRSKLPQDNGYIDSSQPLPPLIRHSRQKAILNRPAVDVPGGIPDFSRRSGPLPVPFRWR